MLSGGINIGFCHGIIINAQRTKLLRSLKALVFVFTMQKHPMTNEYTNGIIGFRYDILLCLTNEPLVGYEFLIPITNQFVFAFVFVFVLAHEQAIRVQTKVGC